MSGVLASITRREGEDVKIGELLAVLDESARPQRRRARPRRKAAASPRRRVRRSASRRRRATPTARRVAKDHDVNLGAVQGSGTAGRVMKQDVQAAMAAPPPRQPRRRPRPPAPAPAAPAPPQPAAAAEPADPPRREARAHDQAPRRRSPAAWSRRSTPPPC